MTEASRGGYYVRVSSPKQNEKRYSVEEQTEDCEFLLGELGASLADTHRFKEVKTAERLDWRPELQRLRQCIVNGELDVVAVQVQDRLARDGIDIQVLKREAALFGARFVFRYGDMGDSEEAEAIEYLLGWKAKRELTDLKRRSGIGKKKRREEGKLTLGARPRYGFDWSPDRTHYVANEETARVVRRAFELVALGWSARKVAALFTKEGLLTPTAWDNTHRKKQPDGNHQWAVITVTKMIRDEMYKGEYVFLRYEAKRDPATGKYKYTRRAKDEQVPYEQTKRGQDGERIVPPLVAEDLWQAANDQLDRSKSRAERNSLNVEDFLLRAGYVRCGYCGNAARTSRHKGRRCLNAYRCNTLTRDRHGCPHWEISTKVIDTAVWGQIEKVIRDDEYLAAELARIRSDQDDPTAYELQVVEQQVAEKTKLRDKLYDRLVAEDDGELRARFKSDWRQMGEVLTELEKRREYLLIQRNTWEESISRVNDFQRWCGAVRRLLDKGELTYQMRRWAVEMLGATAWVWTTDHEPRYEVRLHVGGLSPLVEEQDDDTVYPMTGGWVHNTAFVLVWTDRDLAVA